MKNLLTNFPFDQLGVWATIIVIFTYNVLLERDMACTCKPKEQQHECNLYIVLPTLTVFFLMLLMDKKFQRVWKCFCYSPWGSTQAEQNKTSNEDDSNKNAIEQENAQNQPENPGNNQEHGNCRGVCCRLLCVLVSRFFKALFISGLWVVTVFIDGDWWVCCKNDQSEQQAQLSCKDTNNITTKEKEMIAKLKNTSKTNGFIILLVIVFLAALMSCCPWRKCCYSKKCLYDKLILEEEKIVLTEILRTAAKEKLNDAFIVKIGDKNWEDCYKVADELMKSDKPALSEKQKQEFDKLRAAATGESTAGESTAGESATGATVGATSRSNRSDQQDDQQPQTSSDRTSRSQTSAGESLELKPIGSQGPEDPGKLGDRPETQSLLSSNDNP
ncbi:uncharacterized protein [Channa argus]|uniref:uncharacterized protein isoform X2 n=1 Tax=Channa argus TaxID=215402 RepID=UPI003520DDFF